uniref:Putative secreted protein n=1 Tax=Rhipicephalus microplus TaxID=6941 RepID=A0A6M2DB80_RHIMP
MFCFFFFLFFLLEEQSSLAASNFRDRSDTSFSRAVFKDASSFISFTVSVKRCRCNLCCARSASDSSSRLPAASRLC